MSGNHNQSLNRALQIVKKAALSGADAIKLQTYTADTMTLNVKKPGFTIDDPKSLWNGRHLYELYQEAYTPWGWHEPIMKYAKDLGIHCFSSPFDFSAVDFLEKLNVPAYKIASFEITDIPLIKKVASTKKPIILSTGMASIGEINDAVNTARNNGCNEIVLLKCTSTYPASPENTNLKTIPNIKEVFNCEVGLSDHTMGIGVALGAISLGATVIEKHFTLKRSEGGIDSSFSIEPSELSQLRQEGDKVWQALGCIKYGGTKSELKSKEHRRSLYIGEDLKAGDTLSSKNIRIVRPGFGLAPKYLEKIVGQRIQKDCTAGTPITWELLKE
tara:strand:+ start:64580 stop:65569 length:990 start_codon:yes stop_codon:yes gene_type:complete